MGNGMYHAALKYFQDYVADISDQEQQNDLLNINNDKSLTTTERATLINARLGQGKFRKYLLDYWGKCVITGYNNPEFLIASHIKPWKESTNEERVNPANGLILTPNIDKAFDRYYISFNASGHILISDRLDNPKILGINKGMVVNLQPEHDIFMYYHRQKYFDKVIG